MVYQYRVKGLQKVPAQVAGEVCEALENSTVGLSPKSLLEASRNVNAPLHDEFEWDDGVAAEAYRETQARDIIRNIYVVKVDQPEEEPRIRAFVNAKSETRPGSYHNIRTAVQDVDIKVQLLAAAKRECVSFVAKYHSIEELCGVVREMEGFIF